jgi:hypothetical protein
MITIYEQGEGAGYGIGLDEFYKRVDTIYSEHLKQKRAHAFAFLLYDFENESIRKVLKNHGGVKELDHLAGKDISIFYLHSRRAESLKSFNEIIVKSLGFENEVLFPAVIFFRFENNEVADIKIMELIERDFLSAFKELYTAIENYIANDKPIKSSKNINVLIATVKKVTLEQFFKVIFEHWYKKIFNLEH